MIEKNQIIAYYKLTPDTQDIDGCKAINVYGDHQAVNNKKGFAVESQQQNYLRFTKEYLTKELKLDPNPILKGDMKLMQRIKDSCFKYKKIWSSGENGAYGKCNLFKFSVDLNGQTLFLIDK